MNIPSNKPTLIVDCDGVLLDPIRGFLHWIAHASPDLNTKPINSDVPFLKWCVLSYLQSYNFAQMPYIHKSREAILYLSTHFNIDVITSCGDSKKIHNSRLENLDRIFGLRLFNKVITLPYRSQKKDIFSKYTKGTIVIDDELLNVIDASNCGHNVYWMKYHTRLFSMINHGIIKPPLNDKKKYKRVNWDEIIQSISKNNIKD